MVMSQILKSLDFTKTQKSRYIKNKTLFFIKIKKICLIQIKGYFMTKNSFAVDVTFNVLVKSFAVDVTFNVLVKQYYELISFRSFGSEDF